MGCQWGVEGAGIVGNHYVEGHCLEKLCVQGASTIVLDKSRDVSLALRSISDPYFLSVNSTLCRDNYLTVNLQGWQLQIAFQTADQLAKSGKGIMHRYFMSVLIS